MKIKTILPVIQILIFIGPSIFISQNISEEQIYQVNRNQQSILLKNHSNSQMINNDHLEVLKIGSLPIPQNFDPLDTRFTSTFMRNSLIYDSLLIYDAYSNKLSPALARQWIVSTDSKHWIFYLRDDVFFHDDTKFNSSIVKYNFDRLLDPNHPAYLVSDFFDLEAFPLESVEIISEYIVIINFYKPYAPFINFQIPFYFQMVSPSSFNDSGAIINPIGTGPYRINLKFSNDTFNGFIRFPNHFRGIAPFEEIHFSMYEAESPEYLTAIDNHELDLLPYNFPANFESDEYWDLKEINNSVHLFGTFNYNNLFLKDRIVRKAINHAINGTQIVENIFRGLGAPTRSLIPPGMIYEDKSLPGFPHNITYAQELLNEAGYIVKSNGYRFNLEITGLTRQTEEVLTIIIENLKAVQINATMNLDSNWDHFIEGNYTIFVFGYLAEEDPSFIRYLLHSEGIYNTGNYSNPILDQLLSQGEITPIKQEREFYYSLIQNLIQFEAPLLFINTWIHQYGISKNISSLVKMNKIFQLVFNYSTSLTMPLHQKLNSFNNSMGKNTHLVVYKDISVPSYAIYFPDADLVFSQEKNISNNATVVMSYYLENFLEESNETGKFFSLNLTNPEISYSLRCYYDENEVTGQKEKLRQQKWNQEQEEWETLISTASNTTLRFVEIKSSGNIILRLVFVYDLNFRYLPLAILLAISVGVVVSLIIYWNIKNLQRLKVRYNL
ncbi:MAG: ABC transporter substrate-binding protein [Candidatus Hodarchaeales archaeon]|jgi:peptide/nickel transport system substrate-binding protein